MRRVAACWLLRPALIQRRSHLMPAIGRTLSKAATGDARIEALLDQWVGAKRERNFDVADELQQQLYKLGVNARHARPDPRKVFLEGGLRGPLDASIEAKLDEWVVAKVGRDFPAADAIRSELYAAGVDPAKERKLDSHRWNGGLSRSKGAGPFDTPTEALLDAWVPPPGIKLTGILERRRPGRALGTSGTAQACPHEPGARHIRHAGAWSAFPERSD